MKLAQFSVPRKRIRTVPMGERAPFGEWIPFEEVRAQSGSPGGAPRTGFKRHAYRHRDLLRVAFRSARTLVQKGAKMLFIITGDEWFKGTNAPMRNARAMAIFARRKPRAGRRVANGSYCWIDSRGRICINRSVLVLNCNSI